MSAVDASADRCAADVLAALGVGAFGLGGPALRRAGLRGARGEALSAIGLTEGASRAPRALAAALSVAAEAARARPRAALLCDAPDLHLPAAGLLAAAGVPVAWLIAPQAWAWRPGRASALRARVRRLLCVLPFEEAWFRARGVDACYVGHPLAERDSPPRPSAPTGVAAILPGSRREEVARHLPLLVEAARRLGLSPLVGVAPGMPRPRPGEVPSVDGAAAALARADVALCKSGTVSLEAALAGVPTVVVYRASALTFALARRLVRVPHVALPNLIAGRRAVAELLQDDATPGAIARAAECAMAGDAAALAAELRERLGPPGFAGRTADEIRGLANGASFGDCFQ